jgi:predicted MFS family arabinose efflux permease
VRTGPPAQLRPTDSMANPQDPVCRVTVKAMTKVTRRGGGSTPWRVAATGAATIAVAYGFARYGFGLFVPVLRAEFELSTALIGVVSSASYGSYLIGLLGAGVLTRRHGPRRPVLLGLGAAAVGTALVAVADHPATLAAGVVLAASSPGWCWAPFSDATTALLPPSARERALAVISTGTTFGLLVASPAALLPGVADSGWRWVWCGFATAALLACAANLRLLPRSAASTSPARTALDPRPGHRRLRPGRTGLRRPGSARLLALSAAYGGLGAVYFTFAVDLVRAAGLSQIWANLLWALVGLGGLTGLLTGHLVDHAGLRRAITACALLLTAAIAVLAAAPAHAVLVAISAIAFGAAFMPLAALLSIWSARVHPDRPTTGFTAVLTVLAAASILTPALFGILAQATDMRLTFTVLAALHAPVALLRPASDGR